LVQELSQCSLQGLLEDRNTANHHVAWETEHDGDGLLFTGGQIRMARYAEAISLLLKFALACHSLQLTSSQCKAYLGAVVVWLFAQNAGEAWAVYQVRSQPSVILPVGMAQTNVLTMFI
jgi:hypothetical protein